MDGWTDMNPYRDAKSKKERKKGKKKERKKERKEGKKKERKNVVSNKH